MRWKMEAAIHNGLNVCIFPLLVAPGREVKLAEALEALLVQGLEPDGTGAICATHGLLINRSKMVVFLAIHGVCLDACAGFMSATHIPWIQLPTRVPGRPI